MRILLIGVSALLGRAVARQLVAGGHAVTGVATHRHRNLHPDVDCVGASLGGPVLQRLADVADVVLHLAPIEPDLPDSAGIDGLVRVAHAAAVPAPGWSTCPPRRGSQRSALRPRHWWPGVGHRAWWYG